MSHTTMKTAIAISPMMTSVLNVARIPPAAVTASQMARIAPRTVPMIRPIYPLCAGAPAKRLSCRSRVPQIPVRAKAAAPGGHLL